MMKNKRSNKKFSLLYFVPKQRRGWIRIVEAFIAILLITGVLLIVIDKGYLGKNDASSKIYSLELAVLREIELDETIRQEILGIDDTTLPIEGDFFPINIKNKIDNNMPTYLECKYKICALDNVCVLDDFIQEDVYVQSVVITANLDIYYPRQLKLFCWMK